MQTFDLPTAAALLRVSVAVESAPRGAPLRKARRDTDGQWLIRVATTPADQGVRIQIAVKPRVLPDSQALRRVELRVAGFTGPSVGLRLAYCGAHSRSARSRSLALPLQAGTTESSWWAGAVKSATCSVVLGAEEVTRFATEVLLEPDSITARQHLEGWTIDQDEWLALDPLWLGASPAPPLALLETFAGRMGQAQQGRIGEPPCGWGSWGHWLERIDLGLMRETILALEGVDTLRKQIRQIQIDDGWSEMLESGRVSASWRPNRRFPSGIAPLAAEIRSTGRECGLWLLPFTVNAGSSIEETHPEWLVSDASGLPFKVGGGGSYCLDPTHPGAAEWLHDLFVQLRDWGVEYVKLDFLRALLAPDPDIEADDFDVPRKYAGARTRVEAYRAGMQLIRRAIGERATLLACSAPSAAGVGLVDTHRVGPDIEPHWIGTMSGVRDAARSLLANWFWQGRTWVNDPDYLLPCESDAVMRFWTTVVAMSGGAVILSADFAALDQGAEHCFALATPPLGRAARPVDLFTNAPDPQLLHLRFEREREAWDMVGLLNWTDTPCEIEVQLADLDLQGAFHVWDVWRQAYRRASGSVRVQLGARDAALLRLTALTTEPVVVGTDVHWAQGWLEYEAPRFDSAAGTLTLPAASAAPRSGHVWVWLPPAWRAAETLAQEVTGLVKSRLVPGQMVQLQLVKE